MKNILVISVKLLALQFMVMFEIILMFACFLMGVFKIKPKTALKIIRWSERLPDLKWYYT